VSGALYYCVISDVAARLRRRSTKLQTDTSLSYLAVNSTDTAVGLFRSLVRRSGTRCLTSSQIRHVVPTVLNSFLRQSSLVSTNVTSALEVLLNDMRYINPRLLTYLLSPLLLSTWLCVTLACRNAPMNNLMCCRCCCCCLNCRQSHVDV